MEYLTVYIPKRMIDRRDWIKYLVLLWKDMADKVVLIQSEEFDKFVEKQVISCVQGAKPRRLSQARL